MAYSRNTYIIVGTKSRHEWEEFSNSILTKVLTDGGAGMIVDRPIASEYLTHVFTDPNKAKVVAIVKVDMEDVLTNASFAYVHDFVWATHKFGDPGKIDILGHGSLTATIGAHPASVDHYLEAPQRTFISRVLPQWPPPAPENINPIIDPGVQGLKVIALRQCYAARTETSYVVRTGFGSYEAAVGSAIAITVDELRAKGWTGSGVTVTGSPEYNSFYPNSADIVMAAVIPRVRNHAKSTEVTLPQTHEIYLDNGTAYVEVPINTFAGLLSSQGIVAQDEGKSWWRPEQESTVAYPEHWIRKRQPKTWRITLPEYVIADPIRNKLGILTGKPKKKRNIDEEEIALQQNALKIRIPL